MRLYLLIQFLLLSLVFSQEHIEIPIGSSKQISTTNNTVYLSISVNKTEYKYSFIKITTKPTSFTNPAQFYLSPAIEYPEKSALFYSDKIGENTFYYPKYELISTSNYLYVGIYCKDNCDFTIEVKGEDTQWFNSNGEITALSKVCDVQGEDFFFETTEEMKTNNRLLYVYGYTNDDEKYENQNTDMKIYLSSSPISMNRHFTNGFGYLTNLHDVSRTNLVVRYVKNLENKYYIGARFVGVPVLIYGFINEKINEVCYYSKEDLSNSKVLLNVNYLSDKLTINLKHQTLGIIDKSFTIENRDYIEIPDYFLKIENDLICVTYAEGHSSNFSYKFMLSFANQIEQYNQFNDILEIEHTFKRTLKVDKVFNVRPLHARYYNFIRTTSLTSLKGHSRIY